MIEFTKLSLGFEGSSFHSRITTILYFSVEPGAACTEEGLKDFPVSSYQAIVAASRWNRMHIQSPCHYSVVRCINSLGYTVGAA